MVYIYTDIWSNIEDMAAFIGDHTSFLRFFVIEHYWRAATGSMRARAIFKSLIVPTNIDPDIADRQKRDGTEPTPDRTTADLLVDLQMHGIDIMYQQALIESEGKTPLSSPPYSSIRGRLPFAHATLYLLSSSFCNTLKNYGKYTTEAARAYSASKSESDPKLVAAHMQVYRTARERMNYLENKVGGDRDTLFGIYNSVVEKRFAIEAYYDFVLRSYARLVSSAIKKYTGHSEDDNFQRGVSVGLRRAMLFWDPYKRKAFGGFATWWIQAAILETITRFSNPVRIPPRVWSDWKKFEEIANKKGLVGKYSEIAKAAGATVETVMSTYESVRLNQPLSMETPVGGTTNSEAEASGTIGNSLSSEEQGSSPEAAYMSRQTVERLRQYVECLDGEERTAILCSFAAYDHMEDKNEVSNAAIGLEAFKQLAYGAVKKQKLHTS